MKCLLFSREANNWNEANPIGNGTLGAMIFGQTVKERIQINEDSVWSGGPMQRCNPDAKKYLPDVIELLKKGNIVEAERLARQSMFSLYPHMRHYQTLGDIWITFFDMQEKAKVEFVNGTFPIVDYEIPEITQYKRTLNLENAVGSISYTRCKETHNREYFASYPDQVIVYRMKGTDKQRLSLEIEATRKDNHRGKGASFCDSVYAEENESIYLNGTQGGKDGISFELAIRVKTKGGEQKQMGSHIVVTDAKEVILYITARTTFRSSSPHEWCKEVLDKASKQSYALLKERHIKEYQSYYLRHQLSFETDSNCSDSIVPERLKHMREGKEDPGLIELYYAFARYLLISSSRPGSLPANLQGIWNEEFEPSWGSKYTININTEMNYWMAEKTNLSELHQPLLEHIKRMHPNGKYVANTMYGKRGFCCHHNTDIWGDCAPQDTSTSATLWPMGGAWLCLHIIEHYLYTKDKAFLEAYYEVLQDAVQFCCDYLIKDSGGKYITGPSCSPENIYSPKEGEYGSLCLGPEMDIQILRELFHGFLQVSNDLPTANERLIEEVREKNANLASMKIGSNGQIQEWQVDYEEIDVGHRHISQLFGLYPGNQIRMEKTSDFAKAAAKTLERRLQNGGGHTGWSKAWITLFYARLWDGENAWKNLTELLAHATLDNLLDNHPPFQIDGNFGGACALLEMLVQDYDQEIYLLPAASEKMPNGKVTGVVLKCGSVLDMSWKDGKVTYVKVLATRECKTKLFINGKTVSVMLGKNECYERKEKE